LNETKNQHYLSQAEQRLNAVDETLPTKAQRIYAFDIKDRDLYRVEIRSEKRSSLKTGRPDCRTPRGQLIKKSLSFTDLFSFDHVDTKYRRNLEEQFQRYEANVGTLSKALLDKLRSGTQTKTGEIVGLFSAKLMGFARNPYCVHKALKTFGAVTGCEFTDKALAAEFKLAMEGSRPHSATVCAEFGLTPCEYEQWLRMLFMLFFKPSHEPSVFDQTIERLIGSNYTNVHVFNYATTDVDAVCLLSDRGFNVFDIPINGAPCGTCFEFNVCSRAFASFCFFDPGKFLEAGKVDLSRYENSIEMLVEFNRRTISHCAKAVFAASATPRLDKRRILDEV
jgi:hypothetical protein